MSKEMDCDGCLDRLYEFLDKELGVTDESAIRAHLSGCYECDESFRLERHFVERVRERCTSDTAPKDVRERITLRLRDSDTRPS